MKRKVLTIGLVLVALIVSWMIGPLVGARPNAATDDEIEQAITDGVAWLVAQQNADGSWGTWEQVSKTGFAVVKLEERAFDLGYDSPFDPDYAYSQNVIDGLNYIFSQAASCGPGICFAPGGHETYHTGIAMMAIAASKDPNRVVNVPGSAVDGWTYQQVLQANVNYFAGSQNPDGGWRYRASNQPSDQSNTGYAVLGLSYAEGFGITIPDSVKTGQDGWIDYIQCNPSDPWWNSTDDGGSGYTSPCSWVNELKTGNLIFEMCFVGDDPDDPSVQRFQDALAYIERHWRDQNTDPGWGYNRHPASYQAMYTLMKGLEYCSPDLLLDTDGDGERDDDWFNQEPPASPAQDFASVLVAQQNADGSWPACHWGDDILCTEWALLTLEKVVPPLPVAVDIKPGSCPNPLNVKSKGVLPVAILGFEGFDVTQVDPELVELEGVAPLRWALEDVATPFEPFIGKEDCYLDCTEDGPDGYLDLTLKFDIQEVVDALGEVSDRECRVLYLTGNLKDGGAIVGEDIVVILKKGKK